MSDPLQNDGPRVRVYVLVDEAYASEVNAGEIEHAVAETVRTSDVEDAEVVVTITDDETVRALNLEYLDVDAPTDVLSFPAHQPSAAEVQDIVVPPELAEDSGVHLGDIVIAFPYAQRQAIRYGNSTGAELRLLTVHGALHLLGYDHDTQPARDAMWAVQDAVLGLFGNHGLSDRTYDV